MDTKVSFKRGEDTGGLLADATYRLRVEDVEEKMGKSGFPYMNMRYAVIVNGKPHGGSIWDVLSHSPAARFKIDQFLDSLGAPDTEQEVPPQWFKGKFVWANIETEVYEDKKGKQRLKNIVESYITSDEAELQLAGMSDDGDISPISEPVKKQSTQRATASIQVKTTKGKAAVAEMEEEDFPL